MEILRKSVFIYLELFGACVLTHYEDWREGNQCVPPGSLDEL